MAPQEYVRCKKIYVGLLLIRRNVTGRVRRLSSLLGSSQCVKETDETETLWICPPDSHPSGGFPVSECGLMKGAGYKVQGAGEEKHRAWGMEHGVKDKKARRARNGKSSFYRLRKGQRKLFPNVALGQAPLPIS